MVSFFKYQVLAVVVLGLLTATSAAHLFAQTDSAWVITWDTYTIGKDGKRYDLPSTDMWLERDRVRMHVGEDQYVTIVNDTINTVDTWFEQYQYGPVRNHDMMWLTDPQLTWKRRRAAPLQIEQTDETKRLTGMTARNLYIRMRYNKLAAPMEANMYVADLDKFEVPASILEQVYIARTLVDTEISIDFSAIYDTLEQRRVVPVKFEYRLLVSQDSLLTTGVELVKIERRPLPSKDFFLPPVSYEGNAYMNPTEAMRWELSAVPLPGNRKDRK